MSVTCLAGLLALGACGETTAAPDVNTLNGPSGIVFSCLGNLRVTSEGPGSAEIGDIIWTPMPVDSCAQWRTGDPPAGQETDGEGDAGVGAGPSPPNLLAFILQSTAGSVVLAYSPPEQILGPGLRDPDLLTPGRNAIPVGTLPIGIATDPSGCHVLTANAGSCDLSILDVASAYDFDQRPSV
ncbi:MAG: hypothetical protein GY778_09100, partial [bacterium]|nr:hypothetical protein [bacterium]